MQPYRIWLPRISMAPKLSTMSSNPVRPAEVSLGDQVAHLSAGELAVVPAMVPHGMRNVGTGMLRFVGFFPNATVASIFDQPLLPGNHRVVGTPPWMAALQEE